MIAPNDRKYPHQRVKRRYFCVNQVEMQSGIPSLVFDFIFCFSFNLIYSDFNYFNYLK
jgi:hypothetical protein